MVYNFVNIQKGDMSSGANSRLPFENGVPNVLLVLAGTGIGSMRVGLQEDTPPLRLYKP